MSSRASKRARTSSHAEKPTTRFEAAQLRSNRYECLVPLILDEVEEGDQVTLKGIMLASRYSFPLAMRKLYRQPTLTSLNGINRLIATLKRKDRRFLQGLIRVLNIVTTNQSLAKSYVLSDKQQTSVRWLLRLPSLVGIKIGGTFASHAIFFLLNLPENNLIKMMNVEGVHPSLFPHSFSGQALGVPWVSAAGEAFPKLKKLILKDLRVISQGISLEADNALEELDIVRCSFTNDPAFLMSGDLKRLRRLRIAVTEWDAQVILPVCRKSKCLEELYILEDFDSFGLLFVHPIPTLRIMECRLTKKSLDVIPRIFPNIEVLSGIRVEKGAVPELSACLLAGKFPKLKQLKILDSDPVVSDKMKDVCTKRNIELTTSSKGSEWMRYKEEESS